MVKLQEYQARDIMGRYGIPFTEAFVAASPEEAAALAATIGGTVVVKAQVLVGGRGKAGGVKLAQDPDRAAAATRAILGMSIKGEIVERVLVVKAANIASELYLGAVIDRAAKRVVMMASAAGGVEIEEVARVSPEKICRVNCDPGFGFSDYLGRRLAFGIGLAPNLVQSFAQICGKLFRVFVDSDASLAEINPLAVTDEGTLMAVDSKIVIDDNALFRHADLEALRSSAEEDPLERRARELGFSYVKLDGNIGCMVNGAGLAMATMDVIKNHGGEPANFLDIGGGARADRVEAALRVILDEPNVKAVLINIFGGITRCDEVARGITAALGNLGSTVPMVIRLVGTNEEDGRAILAAAGLTAVLAMDEAASEAVAKVKSMRGGVA